MENNKTFDNFPLWMVIVADAMVLGIYLTGAYIMFTFGRVWGWLYLAFCLTAEIRIMLFSCRYCYYFGKWCCFGRGRLAGLFLKKGEPARFIERQIEWKDLTFDLLVSLIPFLVGVYLLVRGFSWPILASALLLFLLTSPGNAFVRGNIACKYCKQRELGCPAEKLFAKGAK